MVALSPMLAWRYVRSRHKTGFISLISWLSFVGIALGVATLIVVMSVMHGFREELMARVLGMQAHVTVSQRMEGGIVGYDALVAQLAAQLDAESILPVLQGQALAAAGGAHGGAVIQGMRKQDMRQHRLLMEGLIAGALPEEGKPEVVMGSRLAGSLGLGVGDSFQLIAPDTLETVLGMMPRVKTYRVSGLVNVGMFEYDSTLIFMPLLQAQRYFRAGEAVSQIDIRLMNAATSLEVMEQLRNSLPPALALTPWQAQNAHFFNALQVERNVMFLILTLIIMVAALNIISGMVMLVDAKKREIAILRTMGLMRGAVLRIFMLAGGMIGITGTALGVAAGLGFARNIETIRQWLESLTHTNLFAEEIYFLSHLPAIVRAEDVLMIGGVSLLLSLLATIYPAWRAAGTNPVDELH